LIRRCLGNLRPGLLVRLSNIIIMQVVFVFAALALIIFYPQQEWSVEYDTQAVQERFQGLCKRLSEVLAVDSGASGEAAIVISDDTRRSLDRLFAAQNELSLATIHIARPEEGIQAVYAYDGSHHQAAPEGSSLAELANEGALQLALMQPAGTFAPYSFSPENWVYLFRFDIEHDLPAILAARIDHGLLISDRSKLQYALVLLFLCSTLVSLLIVYLLSLKVKTPLDRLLHGMEKTTEGQLFYTIEADGSGELGRIVESFNKMSRHLWDDQKQIERYSLLLKDASVARSEAQAFLATLIDSSPGCIVVASVDGEIVIFNRKATEVFGYDASEVMGATCDRLFTRSVQSEDWRRSRDSDQSLSDKSRSDESHSEVVCCRKDGSLFPAYLVASPIRTSTGEVAAHLFILRDISESKNFQEMMVRLDRYYTRGEMAGDIAHEINNYLAVLSGNIELMPLFMKKGQNDKISRKLELMKTTVDHIAKFTDGLMDVNQGSPRFAGADVNQLIQNMLAFVKPQNRFDGILIDTHLSSDVPLAEIDVGLIQQVLINLLHNASDALSETTGERKIEINSAVIAEGPETRVRIEVIDTGPGVPPDREEILFKERFTTKRRGHGFGLVTCRKIMETHHGRIDYMRRENTVFLIEFPTVHQPTPAETDSTDRQSMTTPTI